jgi:serine protease Do
MNRKVRAKSTNFEMDCFQTDAAISPGNSGGALVDMYGKVIGITSSKYGSSFILGGSYEGLGFAITINQALPIIQELMEKGYVSGRVRIGIQFLDNVNEMSLNLALPSGWTRELVES